MMKPLLGRNGTPLYKRGYDPNAKKPVPLRLGKKNEHMGRFAAGRYEVMSPHLIYTVTTSGKLVTGDVPKKESPIWALWKWAAMERL